MAQDRSCTRRVHPVSQLLTPPRRPEDLRIACRRDVGAALDILPALFAMGFQYGEPVLDYPPNHEVVDPFREPTFAVDLSFAGPADMLLTTTRPPLDNYGDERKTIRQSFTDLEKERLHPIWRRYFARCSRSEVNLQPEFCALLKPPRDTRRHMRFYEAEGAAYKQLSNGNGWAKPPDELKRCTAAFLLRLDEAWPGGPGFIGAFGMDSTCTTIWAYRLGRDFKHLLEAPGFVVAEIELTDIPTRPTNLRWACDCKIEVLLHERFG